MIGTRPPRHPASSTAVFVRLAAFLVATASIVVIPSAFAAVAMGHAGLQAALVTAVAAFALTVLTSAAARRLDPLRDRRRARAV